MKKIKILSLLFCVVMLVAACHDDEEGPIIPQPREHCLLYTSTPMKIPPLVCER